MYEVEDYGWRAYTGLYTQVCLGNERLIPVAIAYELDARVRNLARH